MLVAFDGIDGAGKSTLLRATKNYCDKHAIPFIELDFGSFPEIKPILKESSTSDVDVNPTLRECAYFLEAMLTDQHVVRNIPKDTVCAIDRYTLTYLSYGYLNGAPKALIVKVCELLYKPELYFLVDCPPEVAYERIIANRQSFCPAEFGTAGQRREVDNAKQSFINFQSKVRAEMLANKSSQIILDGRAAQDILRSQVEFALMHHMGG